MPTTHTSRSCPQEIRKLVTRFVATHKYPSHVNPRGVQVYGEIFGKYLGPLGNKLNKFCTCKSGVAGGIGTCPGGCRARVLYLLLLLSFPHSMFCSEPPGIFSKCSLLFFIA